MKTASSSFSFADELQCQNVPEYFTSHPHRPEWVAVHVRAEPRGGPVTHGHVEWLLMDNAQDQTRRVMRSQSFRIIN